MQNKQTVRALRIIPIVVLLSVFLCGIQPAITQDDNETVFSSVEERRIHALLQEEREKIQRDQKAMELREKELKTIEASVDKKIVEIDGKLEELKELQKKIEALLAEKSVEEKRRIKELSAIYEKMVPDRAALAIAGVDQILATEILANMKPKAAAKVLDMLDKQKTSQLSTIYTNIPIE